jgi:hypothetical protein
MSRYLFFLIIFIVVALICLGLFIFFVAKKKPKRHDIEHGTVDVKELKTLGDI